MRQIKGVISRQNTDTALYGGHLGSVLPGSPGRQCRKNSELPHPKEQDSRSHSFLALLFSPAHKYRSRDSQRKPTGVSRGTLDHPRNGRG